MRPVCKPAVPPFVEQFQRVESYAEIEEVMRSPHFVQGGAPERRVFFGDTLIFAEGGEHSHQKRMFQGLMSREAMVYYELHLLQSVIDKVIADLAANRDADGLVRVDIVALVRTMLHRISAGVTGVDGVDTPGRTERFQHLVTRLGEATAGQFTTRDKYALLEDGQSALQALVDEFLQASLDRRRDLVIRFRADDIGKDELPRDMLTAMCLNDDLSRPDDGEQIPYVWRQCSLFLTAAIQTTTHTLPHLFVHLDEWFAEYPEDRVKATDPMFLQRAIAETLRLHQTSPVKFRIAARDVTLSTGRTVREDEMVALFAPSANLEQDLFGADARYFNPDREISKTVTPYGLTFGVGIHMCLGRNLVVGMRGIGVEEAGTHGTETRIVQTLNELGAELDPDRPPRRFKSSYHDALEVVPMILHKL